MKSLIAIIFILLWCSQLKSNNYKGLSDNHSTSIGSKGSGYQKSQDIFTSKNGDYSIGMNLRMMELKHWPENSTKDSDIFATSTGSTLYIGWHPIFELIKQKVDSGDQVLMEVALNLYDEAIKVLENAESVLNKGRNNMEKNKTKLLSLKDSKAYIETLPRWTELWKKVAAYFNNFEPNSDLEAYFEASLKATIALLETETMARYLFLAFGDSDHYNISKECIYMMTGIKLLEVKIYKKYVRNPSEIIEMKPLKPKPVNIYENMPYNYTSILTKLSSLERRIDKATNTLSFDLSSTEEIENSFRPIIRDFTLTRLSLGDCLDKTRELRGLNIEEFTRIIAGLSHAGSLCVYLSYRMRNKEWIGFQVIQYKLQAKHHEALIRIGKSTMR